MCGMEWGGFARWIGVGVDGAGGEGGEWIPSGSSPIPTY